MQFQIKLQVENERPMLPLSYQYELSAWIYKVIENADANFAAFLHHQGYATPERKAFKLFCFSQLHVPRFHIEGDRMCLDGKQVALLIGFYVDRTAEEFIRGLFGGQRFRLGDRLSQVEFSVQAVTPLHTSLPDEGTPVRLRTRSPVVIARKRPDGGHDEYLAPDDPDFGRLLFLNLIEKYRAATGRAIPTHWENASFLFRCVGTPPRSKLITIKSGKAGQTRVRGWIFDFELLVPTQLLELGLMAGFGRQNSEGFGCAVLHQH